MLTIDLLNGTGKPPRSHPLRAAGVALAFMLLGVGAVLDGLQYSCERSALALQKRTLTYYAGEVEALRDVARTLDKAQKRQEQVNAILTEVNKALATHMTWSNVLLTVSQSASRDIVVPDIMAKREEKGTAGPIRYAHTLMVGVMSPSRPAVVEQFVRTLRLGLPLQSDPDSIRIISQRQETVAGQPLQHYVIECRLKV